MGGCAERATYEGNSIKDDRALMVIEYLKQQEEDKKYRKAPKKSRKTFDHLHDSESEYLETRKTQNQQPLILFPIEKPPKSPSNLNSKPSPNLFGGKSLILGKGLPSRFSDKPAVIEENQNIEKNLKIEVTQKVQQAKTPVFAENENKKVSFDLQNNLFSSNSESIQSKKLESQDSLELEKSPIGIKLNSEFNLVTLREDVSSLKIIDDSELKNESSLTFNRMMDPQSPQNIKMKNIGKQSFTSLELEKQAFGVSVSPLRSIDLKISPGLSEQFLPSRVSINTDIASINSHKPLKSLFSKNFKMPEINILTCLEPEKPIIIQKEVIITGNSKRPLSPRIENNKPKYKHLLIGTILKSNETVIGKPPGMLEGKNPFSIAGSFIGENFGEKIELEPILERIESGNAEEGKVNEKIEEKSNGLDKIDLSSVEEEKAEKRKKNKIIGFGLGLIHDSVLGEYYEDSELRFSEIDKNELEGSGRLEVSGRFFSKKSSNLNSEKKKKKSSSSEIEAYVKLPQNTENFIQEYEENIIEFQKLEVPDYSSQYMVSENLDFPQSKNSGLKKSSKKALRSHRPDLKPVQFLEAPDQNTVEDIEVENVIFSLPENINELDNQPSASFPSQISKKKSIQEHLFATPDNLMSTPDLDIFNIGSQLIYINPESVQLPTIEASRRSLSPTYIVKNNRVGGSDDELEYHRESSYEHPIRAESPNIQNYSMSSLNSSIPEIKFNKLDKNDQSLIARDSFNIPDLRASLNSSGIFFKNNKMHLLRRSPNKLAPELFKKNLEGKLTADEEIKHSIN